MPSDKVGDINSDMSGRRGRVLGMDSAGGDLQTVIAEVPLAEVTTYARSSVEHDRRPGQLHDGVQPLRRRARQRAEEIIEKAVMRRKRRRSRNSAKHSLPGVDKQAGPITLITACRKYGDCGFGFVIRS